MAYDPADPWNPAADRLVLSEGHAVPIVYAAYADLGGAVGKSREAARPLGVADVDGLRTRESELDGHPNPGEGFPFFDAATGSLGQGLSVAAGLALAARLDGSPRRIYAIIGDGESREGQVWEAADFIVDHKLNAVCAIFNCNGQGQAGLVSKQQSAERITAKLEAFGWKTATIDGHDPAAIEHALSQAGRSERPLAIVARTVKGWGSPELQEGNWHGKPVSANQLEAVCEHLRENVANLTRESGGAGAVDLRPPAPPKLKLEPRPSPAEAAWPSFEEAMAAGGFADVVKKGKLATRKAYGAALKVAGDLLPQVVCLDADVSNSTFSEIFRDAHPERFFECKIAEQNMVSAAVGLSAAGRIPFANSFAKFIARAYDQVEMASISRANVKLVGSHAGVTLAADGPSQMALPDVAYFRSFASVRGDDRSTPLCRVYLPADAVAAYHCTRLMVERDGLCYMRTLRPELPLLYAAAARFEPGGVQTLANGDDLAIVASGYMVHEARRAMELLASQRIRATLIDAYTLPIDPERLLEAIPSARPGVARRVFVVEDNYGGGVGAEVAEICAGANKAGEAPICVRTLHVQCIPKSTLTAEDALDYAGVAAPQIADHVRALLA
jgi:transketolase